MDAVRILGIKTPLKAPKPFLEDISVEIYIHNLTYYPYPGILAGSTPPD
jgi:hypothetical protein